MNKSWCIAFVSTVLAAALMATGCRRVEDVAYSDFRSFGSEGWDPETILSFAPWPMDSVVMPHDRFDMVLTIRYTPHPGVSVIPIEITEEDENGVTANRRINVRLRKSDGTPRGHRDISLYEISDTIRRRFVLPQGYLVELTSLSPPDNTAGLKNIGISLCETGHKKTFRHVRLLK